MSEKLTVCKICGAEVAKSAKVCPRCGAKLKKKHPVLLIILIIIGAIIVIGAIGSGGSGSSEPEKVGETAAATSAPAVETKQSEFGVGEIVNLNDVEVTLLNVTENSGSEFNQPTDGNVFVLCEFEVANNSDREITVSSILCFEAYCDDYAVNESLSASLEKGNKGQLDGTVAPGKKINGVIGYEVPTDWGEMEIHFTPDFWSGKDITFVATH